MHAKVYDADNAEYARTFLNEAIHKYGIRPRSLVVHSDNGASMKANETKALLEQWGIISSHSRPRVSNDNPYSESFFRSLKYSGRHPRKGFESIEAAQQWLEGYLLRYNEQSYHSGVNWVTPKSRFDGTEEAILKARKQVLERARERHPDRWVRSRVWDCTPSPEASGTWTSSTRPRLNSERALRVRRALPIHVYGHRDPSLYRGGNTIKLSHIAPPYSCFENILR